ncbi:hypothetical protein GTQ99_22650 [Kineococcus sp. T13]|uniref:hypothetical protein n=1 Tax=Kineococcus vitellinus TaxID=2696565 RepID=UPI0014136620|nr:hypothetical protein [Kineococcus vitellinus]NAZ78186.1 hypothetical protein [Kineococcus vitellinus]
MQSTYSVRLGRGPRRVILIAFTLASAGAVLSVVSAEDWFQVGTALMWLAFYALAPSFHLWRPPAIFLSEQVCAFGASSPLGPC